MRTVALSILIGLVAGTAGAASPFDGLYGGSWTHNGGTLGPGKCPDGGSLTVRVKDGAFLWRGGGEATTVRIGADGGFSGQSGQRFISGRVAGGKITATTRDQYCVYDWALATVR